MKRIGGWNVWGWLVLTGWLLLGTTAVEAQTIWWDTGLVKLRQDNSGNGDPIPTSADFCHPSGCDLGGVTLTAAQNEYEPFQIFIAGPASSIDVIVSDLVNGESKIPAFNSDGRPKNIVLYREHYLNITSLSSSEGQLGYWPDALIPKKDEYFGETRTYPGDPLTKPAFPFDVASGKKQGVWIDVYVPIGTPPGTYTGTFLVKSGTTTLASIPVSLAVNNFQLPSTPSLKTAYSVGVGPAAQGHYGTQSITDAQNWELICLYTKELLLNRITNENVIWPAPSWNGTSFNWTLSTISTSCNQRYPEFLTGGDPNLLPNGKLPGAKATRARLKDRLDNGQNIGLNDPNHQSASYYQQYIQHFADQGWKSQLFYYLWDEPHWNWNGSARVCDSSEWPALFTKGKFFKDQALDIPMMVTTSKQAAAACFSSVPGAYSDYIDFWSPGNILVHGKPQGDPDAHPAPYNQNNRKSYDSGLGIGSTPVVPGSSTLREFWWYHACNNHDCGGTNESGYSTPMADLPNIYSRIFEWLTYQYSIGYISPDTTAYTAPGPSTELYYETVYAYQSWNGTPLSSNDPWTTIYYFTGNGDGTLFYPGRPNTIGPSGGHHIPISSIRLKMIREGIEDYEYLTQVELKKKQEGMTTAAAKKWIQDNIIKYISTSGTDGTSVITYSWNKNPGSPTATAGLLRAREELRKVLSGPDFSISVNPSSGTVPSGPTPAVVTPNPVVTVSSLNGFNSAVSLSCSTPHTTITCSLSPTSVTPPGNGSATSSLTVTANVTSATPTGSYAITVTGTAGSTQHATTFTLTVQSSPDFSVSVSPTSGTLTSGSSPVSVSPNPTVTVRSINSFTSNVGLTCTTSHPSVTCSLNPTSVTPPANGTVTSSLTVTANTNSATPPGNYTVTVTGTSGSTSHQATFTLTVQASTSGDFSISIGQLTPIYIGSSSTATVTVTSLNSFNSLVSLSCSTSYPTVTCSLNPTSVTPTANGNATSTLTVTVSTATPLAPYTIVVKGTSGTLVHDMSATAVAQDGDQFNRAATTNLGSQWNEYLTDLEIYNNQIRNADGNSLPKAALFNRAIGPDQDVAADCMLTASGNSCGVMARWSDDNNFYRARIDVGQGNVVLAKTVSGNTTVLASANVTLNYNQFYRIRLVVKGTTLNVYFNGGTSPSISMTDSSLIKGDYAGIRSFATAPYITWFDNFAVSVPFSDTFDRPNSTNLGGNWNEYLTDLEIFNNQLRNSDGGSLPKAAQWTQAIGPDQDVMVDCKLTQSGNSCGVMARWSSESSFYRARLDVGAGNIAIAKTVGGATTTLATANRTLSYDQYYRIRFIVNGSTLSVYFANESTPMISINDSSITAGNYAGIRSFATGPAITAFENFNATVPGNSVNVLFSDNFNRTGTDLGSNWRIYYGGFSTNGATAVSSGTAGAGKWAGVVPSMGTNDYTVQADLTVPASTHYNGIIVRGDANDISNQGYVAQLDAGGFVYLYRRNTGGVWTLLQTVNVGTILTTQSYTVALQVAGSNPVTLNVYFQGAQVVTNYQDSTASRVISGIPGIQTYDPNVKWDNFTVFSAATRTTDVLYSDDFNRTTGMGSDWNVFYGSYTTDGASAASAGSPANWAGLVPSLGTNDYAVEASITAPSGSAYDGIFVRSSNPSDMTTDLYSVQISAVSGTVKLYRRNASTWTLLESMAAPGGITPDTTFYKVKLIVTGSNPVNLEVDFQGSLLFTYADSDPNRITSGIPGLVNYNTNVKYDYFTVTTP